MGPRLVILVVLAIGLAVFLALRASRPAQVVEAEDAKAVGDRSPEEREQLDWEQKQLSMLPLECNVPADPPELSIRWEVPPGDKQAIRYYIDEAHGYYVETFDLEFFYKPTPDTTVDESPVVVPVYVDNYLKANETFHGCAFVVSAELKDIGGQMGTTENWGAEIVDYGRYCATNPEKLVPRSSTTGCDH